MKAIPLWIALGSLALGGCARTDDVQRLEQQLAALERDLGGWRYQAREPQVMVKIRSAEWIGGKTPKIRIVGIVQEVERFVLPKYRARLELEVEAADSTHTLNDWEIVMENGSAAFEIEHPVWGTKYADILSATVAVERANLLWSPLQGRDVQFETNDHQRPES